MRIAGPAYRGLRLVLLAVASAWLLPALAGPLMAVDFGGEAIRVSVVKPGRTPISVVLNEASKRKTSAQVAFVDNDRLLGEEAALLGVKFPERVYSRVRDLLGKQANDDSLQNMIRNSLLPYTIVPHSKDRPTAAIKTHSGEIYSAEELVASILHYARSITQASVDGAAVLDCVITVPAFWGMTQRQALIDAAKIAGLNVLALVNSHAAAALQYGIERDFTNKSEQVILYDMGATSTECALVEFSSFRVKEGGSWKTYGQLEVKDVTWDSELGSEALDSLLLEFFANEFEAAHPGLDLRASPKAVAKLKRQVKRTKEVLSANSFAPISVEELMNGIDFRSRIERAEFEKLATAFLQRASEPLKELLVRNKVTIKDLTAVELLGGGSRVPAVKAALSQTLGGRQLDMHLDADEAVVLGAGLVAANLSTTFRLRKFGLIDGITYPIAFQLEQPEGVVLDESLEGHFKPKALLPRMKRLPARRNVPLPTIPSLESLTAHLFFNTSDSAVRLPPGVDSERLATFQISGSQEVWEKHNQSGKLSLHIRADESGLVSLEKGEAVVEVTEEYTIKVPVEESGSNATSADSAGADKAEAPPADQAVEGNDTDINSTDFKLPVFKDVLKTRKRTLRLPLSIGGPGFLSPGLSPEGLQASRKVLEGLAAAEAAKKEASKQKNELEAYIIDFRGRLESDESAALVTTEIQRTKFLQQLENAEEWLYSEGEKETAAVFKARIDELKNTGDPINLRVRELKALPKALKAAQDFVKVARQAVGGWASTKPWLNATEVQELQSQIDEFEVWLKAEAASQQKRKPYEDPTLLSTSVNWRTDAIRKPFNRLKAKKKPKPPPPPKQGNMTTNGTAENSTEADSPADDVKEAPEPQGGASPSEGGDSESKHIPDHSEL